jgi:hypothetical protein
VTVRKIELLVVHSSGHSTTSTVGAIEINDLHLSIGDPGLPYHAVIRRDGVVERGLRDEVVGRASPGFDEKALHVCLVGGLSSTETFRGAKKPAPEYTDRQLSSLRELIGHWRSLHPGCGIISAYKLDRRRKSPCFDVAAWYVSGEIMSSV